MMKFLTFFIIVYFSIPTFAQRLPFSPHKPNNNSHLSKNCPPNLYYDYRNRICHNLDYSITAIPAECPDDYPIDNRSGLFYQCKS
ncbi:MAG TPA: hypothetical protein ACHBZ9_05115 [Arsenophonus nasoniae]|uniref:hypothetical protein n=1 Tax=Arsenophonus nasoniae TaxID=638 RepID=UPI00387A2347